MKIREAVKKDLMMPRKPKGTWEHQDVVAYVESIPDADYERASQKAYDAFRDIKFAVRIHWGPYSMTDLAHESWPFLAMSHEDKQAYQQLYHSFNPKGFDSERWMELFKKSGIQCFAFTTKHHDGFSMYHTKTKVKKRVNWTAEGGPAIEDCDLHYSVEETPFGRDIVKELCDSARRHGIKIDLYYSHPDWYDADFRPYAYSPMLTTDLEDQAAPHELEPDNFYYQHGKQRDVFPAADKEARRRMMTRHREQLLELVQNYGEIDMVCLDQWLGHEVWPELRQTLKAVRKAAPDVMLRARGIGNYGDYHTPEGVVPGSPENTNMPWMCIYPLGSTFSYDSSAEHYKGTGWMIKNLIDCVAKGGGFMVGIGPDANGCFHPEAERQLLETGKWLEVNGEAIYGAGAREGRLYRDGNKLVRYTCGKDGKTLYACMLERPEFEVLNLTYVDADALCGVTALDSGAALIWERTSADIIRIDVSGLPGTGLPQVLRLEFSREVR